ncbi:hypothetical protein A2U01_0025733, partial [Trifolium medium]|nr:hypothetical protein [Trifolium medium]
GEFLEYDEKNENMAWVKYMRLRVLVDIRLPLKKSKKIKKPGGESKVVIFKYERLGTYCYICGMLGHSEMHCPKLFDAPDVVLKREWGPELRAEMGRKQSGGASKWLRDEGNPNWVAPNPVFMSNQCSNSQGVNSVETEKKEKGESKGIAELYRNPQIFFPIQTNVIKEGSNHEVRMEEDDEVELMIEGDRKRSRNQLVIEKTNDHVEENNSSKSQPHTNEQNFLLAGPGGARQG